MRKVTLYQATKREVSTFAAGSIPIHTRVGDIQFAHNDPEHRAFLKSEVSVDHCAIERFCWHHEGGAREVYVAFDTALLEIIGCKQSQVDQQVKTAVDCQKDLTNESEIKCKHLESVLKRYDTMTLWQRIKWVFKIQ